MKKCLLMVACVLLLTSTTAYALVTDQRIIAIDELKDKLIEINEDNIYEPDLIFPGDTVYLPSKYGRTHTVKSGECLWYIAEDLLFNNTKPVAFTEKTFYDDASYNVQPETVTTIIPEQKPAPKTAQKPAPKPQVQEEKRSSAGMWIITILIVLCIIGGLIYVVRKHD